MIKFSVNVEKNLQFNLSNFKSVEEYFFEDRYCYNEIIAVYNTLEEARKHLETIDVSTVVYGNNDVLSNVAYIEEADYELNDDGKWEFIAGSNIYDFKCEEIKED